MAIAGATMVVIGRAQDLAEQRRQAQTELRRVEAMTHEARLITVTTTLAAGPKMIQAQGQGGRSVSELLQAVRSAEALDVEGEAMRGIQRDADQLLTFGTGAIAAALRGDDAEAERIRAEEIVPALDRILAATDVQLKVEAKRAADASRLARGVLIGGVLIGLLLLAAVLRRIDISARRGRADEMLRRQAYTDVLTGLPNRAALELAVDERLAQPGEIGGDGPVAALALLDLDDLKTINDSLGHSRGDDLIKTIGARVAATLGPHDMACRFGGDEFGILFADPTAEAAVESMQRVLAAISRPVLVDDRDIRVSASAGVSVGSDREGLVRDADVAMYAAKGRGKDRVTVFDQSMRDNALVNLELTADLRRALTRDELYLEFQPIVDLRRGLVDGVEALVRWQHPVRGRIAPLDFIPIAERTGLIGPLGWWVMRTSCAQMRSWLDSGMASPAQHISVNVSPLQLAEPDMARRIARILDETGLDPRQLQLEITESVLVDEPAALVADLTELMSLGVRIAIDDFGTGHSVLAYLRDLPVDVLKIDKAFVDSIDTDPSRARLTTGIAQLAQALNLTIVAEGIETAPQARMLREMGDLLGQGFLFSRPVSASIAGGLLREPHLGPPLTGGLSEVA